MTDDTRSEQPACSCGGTTGGGCKPDCTKVLWLLAQPEQPVATGTKRAYLTSEQQNQDAYDPRLGKPAATEGGWRGLLVEVRNNLLTAAFMTDEELDEEFNRWDRLRNWAERIGNKAHALFPILNALEARVRELEAERDVWKARSAEEARRGMANGQARMAAEAKAALAQELFDDLVHFDDESGHCAMGCSHRWNDSVFGHRHRRGDKCKNIGTHENPEWHDATCAFVQWHDALQPMQEQGGEG